MRKAALALAAILLAAPLPGRAAGYLMYVGTQTDGGSPSKGVYAWRFDPAKATLKPLGLKAEANNLVHLWAAPNGRALYGINWQRMDNEGFDDTVSAYAVDRKTGALKLLNMIDSKGLPPAEAHVRGGVDQVVLDPSGRIAVACNAVGTLVAFPIEAGGKVGKPFYIDRHPDDGAVLHAGHRVGTMVHGAEFSPDGKWLYVADLGLDRIYIYRVDAAKRSVTPFDTPFVSVKQGSGPRRLQIHPSGKFLYVDHEQESAVKAFRIEGGKPVEIQSLTTIPPGWQGRNSNSEIQIDRTGRYLYVANRGVKDSSIAAYSIDQASGSLTSIGFTPVQGVPANITIDPTNRFLFAASAGADQVIAMAINPNTGQLAVTGPVAKVASPGAVRFVAAP